jgi:hypothetical protein
VDTGPAVLWNHWHSVLVTLAPLALIVESGRRWRRRARDRGGGPERSAGP